MDASLQININKCEIEITHYKYLGLIVNPNGINMDKAKVKAHHSLATTENGQRLTEIPRLLEFLLKVHL
jgi:hypothetical protein